MEIERCLLGILSLEGWWCMHMTFFWYLTERGRKAAIRMWGMSHCYWGATPKAYTPENMVHLKITTKKTSSSIPTSILPSRDLLEADVTIQLLRRPMTLGTLPTEAQGAVLLQDLATAVGREGSGTALGPSIALAARTATMAQLVTMQRAEGELPVTPETRGLQVIIGCSWNSFVLGPLGYQLRFPSAEALWWQCALNATGGAEVLDFRGVSYSPKSFQPIFDFSDRWSKPLRRYWKLVWGGHVKRETQTPDDDTVDGSQIRRFTSWGW